MQLIRQYNTGVDQAGHRPGICHHQATVPQLHLYCRTRVHPCIVIVMNPLSKTIRPLGMIA